MYIKSTCNLTSFKKFNNRRLTNIHKNGIKFTPFGYLPTVYSQITTRITLPIMCVVNYNYLIHLTVLLKAEFNKMNHRIVPQQKKKKYSHNIGRICTLII